MIAVVNRKNHEPTDLDVYVGRGSPLGNPFRINFRTTREEAIEKYETELQIKIKNKDKVICNELNRIYRAAKVGDVNLVCYCKPENCHADFIKRLIEEKL
jgi:hypothetical protein